MLRLYARGPPFQYYRWLLSDFRYELFYRSSESPGFSFSLFYITRLKRIPQTSFTYNFGDISRKSVAEVVERVSLEGDIPDISGQLIKPHSFSHTHPG